MRLIALPILSSTFIWTGDINFIDENYIVKFFDLLLLFGIFLSFFVYKSKLSSDFLLMSLYFVIIACIFSLSEILRSYPKISFFKFFQIAILIIGCDLLIKIKNSKDLIYLYRLIFTLGVFSYLFHFLNSLNYYDHDSFLGLFIGMRIRPGSNNLGSTLLMFSIFMTFISINLHKNNIKKHYIIYTLIFILMMLMYPSRQVLIGILILLLVLLYYCISKIRLKFSLLIFLCLAILFFYNIGLFDYISARFMKHINLGNDYSRILQYKIGFEYFLKNPFFGSIGNPYEGLKNTPFTVFESSITDLLLRDGLFGLFLVILPILYMFYKNKFKNIIFVFPFIILMLFNEVIYEEEIWLTIMLLTIIEKNIRRRNINYEQS